MAMSFEIVLKSTWDGTEERVKGSITDADWRRLTRFREMVADLRATRWVQAGLDTNFTVRGGKGKTKVTWRKRPSRAMVSEFLHRLRPFVLETEPTFYPRLNKLLRRRIDHPFVRSDLDAQRAIFHHGGFARYGQLMISGLPLYNSQTFSRWLNGFEYHRNDSDRQTLAEAFSGPPDELALAVFYSIAADRAKMVMHFATFIDYLERRAATS